MRFIYTVTVIVLLTTFISWLNHRLLSRLFPFYRAKIIKYGYSLMTLITIFVVGYGFAKRPPFSTIENQVDHYWAYGALDWLFGQLILFSFQPLIYVAHRFIRGKTQAAVKNSNSSTTGMTRRDFLHNTLAVAPVVAIGISTNGIYEAQTNMILQRYSLSMPDLPSNLNGFKIGQISDTHLGPYFDLSKLDTAIKLLAQEKPDIVVITGDFADDLNLLKPAIDRFNKLEPSIPHGIYFCLGNHDYFRDITMVRAELNKSRIKNLENESILLVPGERPFYLLGVEYPWASNNAQSGINVSVSRRQQNFAAANQNVPSNAFKVLIAHHPDALIDGFAAQIPLTITGHTHGGQVVIGGKSLLSNYAYMRGLYQENGVYGYVSSGTGHWFPLRIGCPAEVSLFTLQG
ncbi:metallophosphoesterase [Pelosinus sp. sgz500959]|uniref:metallophosphoesterase n=1 Tax=Pelosinus sp. sgz500959 TaxID=3242472 RepID=UPI0036726DA5